MFANGREFNQRRIPFGKFLTILSVISVVHILDFSSFFCFQVSVVQDDDDIPAYCMIIFSDSWISFVKDYKKKY